MAEAFRLIQKLPAYLDVLYMGRVYEGLVPCLKGRGSKIDICYVGCGRVLVLYERIEDEQELTEAIEWVCDHLNGVTVYKAGFFPRV